MAIDIRLDGSLFLAGVVTAYNTLVDVGLTTQKHRDKTAVQNGSSLLPSSTPLLLAYSWSVDGYSKAVNEMQGALYQHMQDASAHLKVDAVNVNFDGYAIASKLATEMALANAIKVDYNNHGSQSGVHLNNDASHQIAAGDATDELSLGVLLSDINTKLTAHLAASGLTQRYNLIAD